MKKLGIISLLIISIFGIRLNVNAAAKNAISGDDNYSQLKSSYDNGITEIKVSNSDIVTIYGKSECNGTSCTISYAGGNSSYEDVLKKSVICTNGENSITAQVTGTSGKRQYDTDNKAKYSGTVYWSEEYHVTCTNNGTVTLNNTLNNVTNNNSQTNNGYNSSTTVENEQTGVNTYFIVLGIMTVISYGIMLLVKRYNLFKSI